ncbi:MAG: SPFH domain-containing protein [Planctomycetota bacterium]
MKGTLRLSVVVLLLFFGGVLVYANLQKVEVGQVGVLTREWGGGLVEEDYGPGYWLDLGPLHTWNVFDSTVQTYERSDGTKDGPFVVKSRDGADVSMDVSVKYRIKPGEAWQILKRFGPGDAHAGQGRQRVRRRDARGLRRPPDRGLLRPARRQQTADDAKTKLGERLAKLNVQLVVILIRDVTFSQSYEDRIKQKELAKQEADVNIAKKKAAEAAGLTNKIMAETEAMVTVIQEEMRRTIRDMTAENQKKVAKVEAEANQFVVETKADADLYKAEKVAASDLMLRNAEAEAQALRRKALTLPGARNLVALEAAGSLNFDRLVISTLDNNVLDLEALAERLGAVVGSPGAAPDRDD